MSDIQIIALDQIDTGARMRPSYDGKVAALAASIAECAKAGIGHTGLRYPIEVRQDGERYVVISGLHRMRAVETLNHTSIAAVLVKADTLRAEMLELEENLVRADLNALDRALFVKRFREIFEAEHGEINPKGGRPEKNSVTVTLFSEAAIERLGMGVETCKRALRIANGLHAEAVRLLRVTDWGANSAPDWTDNQKALLELASVSVERQTDVVSILSCFPGMTMREAIEKEAGAEPPAQKDEDEKWFRKSCAIFTANKRLRRRFFAEALISDFEVLRETAEENGFTVEPIKGWKG